MHEYLFLYKKIIVLQKICPPSATSHNKLNTINILPKKNDPKQHRSPTFARRI